MNFLETYNKIINRKQRLGLRDRMINTFGISKGTFYKWTSGDIMPPKRYHAAIAEIMGEPVSVLFPTLEKSPAQL